MKVAIKIKEGNTVHTEQREIEEINILQMTNAIKVIKEIFDVVKEDAHLQGALEEIFFEAQQTDDQEVETEDTETTEKTFSDDFIKNIVGALDVLIMEVPEKVFKLLSVLSNIEYDTFMQQKPDDVFDIYDAIIEVNDIEKLVNRAKKSLRLTKAQTKVMSLFQKKETDTEQPQLRPLSSSSQNN